MENDDAVNRYRTLYPYYQSHALRFESLVTSLLTSAAIRVHFTESRAKSPESFAEKISRPGKSYKDPFVEIPDLVGVRVVLYYQDDVEAVSDLIKREFQIVEEERAHLTEMYSPDTFGYLSLHFIVCLNQTRSCLPEWKDVSDLKVELQVRTVLQHSWAAISHALQYKREGDVPLLLRRKLYRLAGLFELADEQFVEIRDEAGRLTAESKIVVKRNIDASRIDALIVRELLSTSNLFKAIKNRAEEFHFVFEGESWEYLGQLVEELERLSVKTIKDFNKVLRKDFDDYLKAVVSSVDRWNVSDDFFFYLILIGAYPEGFSEEYLLRRGWAKRTANRVAEGASKGLVKG